MSALRREDLRHRVTIRRATETSNGKGGYSTAWDDVTTVFAEVTGIDGRESVMDQVLQGVSFYRIRLRFGADVGSADQLRSTGSCFGGRDVNVRSVADPDGRRHELALIADTGSTR